MILYPREFWPCGSLPGKQASQHVLRSRIAEDFGKVGIRYGGKDVDITRVALVEKAPELCYVGWKDTNVGKDLKTVQHFSSSQTGCVGHPARSSHERGTLLHFRGDHVLFL
jgi:hypothetical protein